MKIINLFILLVFLIFLTSCKTDINDNQKFEEYNQEIETIEQDPITSDFFYWDHPEFHGTDDEYKRDHCESELGGVFWETCEEACDEVHDICMDICFPVCIID